jgi:hypothetical protein
MKTHRDFIEVIEYNFCKIAVNYRDSMSTVISNVHIVELIFVLNEYSRAHLNFN